MSDGQSNMGPELLKMAELAAKHEVKVYTVGIGTPEGDVVHIQGRSMRVIDEAIALRPRPSSDCNIDTQVLHGEEVIVYDIDEGWAWGQLVSDGYVGYMPADSLHKTPLAPTHHVHVPRTFLYAAPNMKTPPVGALPMGAKVEVPTIHGPVTVTVPKGANTGRTLRLKGKGITAGKSGTPGDQ